MPTPIPTPADLTLADFGIITQGLWTTFELNAIMAASITTGDAFVILSGDNVPSHIKFKEVMGVSNANGVDQGTITLIRGTQLGGCIADNNNRTITCSNLVDSSGNPREITQYVIGDIIWTAQTILCSFLQDQE